MNRTASQDPTLENFDGWYHRHEQPKHGDHYGHCEGCDQDEKVAPYECRFDGIDDPQEVVYCRECADLARMNWNGETISIRPIIRERFCR